MLPQNYFPFFIISHGIGDVVIGVNALFRDFVRKYLNYLES